MAVTENQHVCSGFGCSQQQKRHAAAPPPAGVRRRLERNRQVVGRDKGSLTEQQTEGTGTTMIQKKGNIQNKPAEQNGSLGPHRR